MMTEKIEITFSLYDKDGKYSLRVAVSMVSIMETISEKRKIRFHLLHDDTLTEDNKIKFKQLIKNYNQEILFYYVKLEKNSYIKLRDIDLYSPGALYRLKLADLVNVNKIIYLDADIICNLDIRNLFEENINDYAIGAILDKEVLAQDNITNNKLYRNVPLDLIRYFNSGVILFNLEYIRKNYDMFKETMNFLGKYPNIPYSDQAALNFLFQKKCRFLNCKYNWGVKKGENNECIYHFSGIEDKPWNFKTSPLRILYWKYFLKTPWCNGIADFIYEYDKSDIPLEKSMLIGRILSRKIFVKNFFLRLKKEIKNKFEGK